MVEEYKPGEFCKEVGCPIQKQREKSESHSILDIVCEQSCVISAHEVFRWLKRERYQILKFPENYLQKPKP